jgi:hypothetical protein
MALGGKSCKRLTGHASSGDKECPMHAAWGLWRLQRIKPASKSPAIHASLNSIDSSYGCNAVYAVIAADRLLTDPDAASISETRFWVEIRIEFKNVNGRDAAKSNQGSLTITRALFNMVLLQ